MYLTVQIKVLKWADKVACVLPTQVNEVNNDGKE